MPAVTGVTAQPPIVTSSNTDQPSTDFQTELVKQAQRISSRTEQLAISELAEIGTKVNVAI